jgi:glycerophosphoryl diester phosphodiesterase
VDFTLEEVQKLDAGSWKAPRFAGARVPTFQQMIDLVKGKAGLFPETKEPEFYGRYGMKMEKLLMDVLARNRLDRPGSDPRTPVVIQSFSADSLKVLRKDCDCKLPLVFLVEGRSAAEYTSAEGLKKVQAFADGIAPDKQIILARPALVRDAHEQGLSVTAWTFRSRDVGKFESLRREMAYFVRDLRVDALFTDNPDQFPRD